MAGQQKKYPYRTRPWAAIVLGGLTGLMALIGVVLNIPTETVTVEVRGTVVTAEQVRAALGGELKAYEHTRILVCDAETAPQCSDPQAGTVAVVVNGTFAGARVQKNWLPVPHNEENYEPDGDDMVRDAFSNAYHAGQRAGAVALAARAAVDAQSQALNRTPLAWLAITLAGALGTVLLARRHAARSRDARKLWHDLAVGSRHLATVTLDLELTRLASEQLDDLPDTRTVRCLKDAAAQVSERSLELTRSEAGLYERLPRGMPTMADLSQEDAAAFRRSTSGLDELDDGVVQGTALLLDSPAASVAWDSNARPYVEAADHVRTLAAEGGIPVEGELAAAIESLEGVRAALLPVGARWNSAISEGAADEEQTVALLTDAARRTSEALRSALLAGLGPAPRLDRDSALRRVAELSAQRPGPPLLRALASEEVPGRSPWSGGDAFLSLDGLDEWWVETRADLGITPALRPGQGPRTPWWRADRPESGQRPMSWKPAIVLGALVLVIVLGTQGALIAGTVLGQNKTVHYVSLPTGAGWEGIPEADAAAAEVRAFVPWRLAVLEIPAAPEEDVVVEAKPDKYSSGRRFKELKLARSSELLRTAFSRYPELVDPATGDLYPDVMVNVVRPVGQGEYREIGLAWGPTAAPRLSGKYLGNSGSDTAERPRFIPYAPVYRLKQDLATSLGKPAWTESQATKVGVGTGAVLLAGLLLAIPSAVSRRRRDRTVSRKENDRRLREIRTELEGLFLGEDSAALNAVTAEVGDGAPELEDRRLRVRAQTLALRRCEELETRHRRARGQEAHAFDVERLGGLVDALTKRELDLGQRVRDYLATL
ncbi:DUF5129 domain-containing protein [Arthrobacter sp. NPDC090010]|uniref:DUF5129 domain-containing protein n=1 Tax=Arthrobacter sp. NPDC090010 TaxID=3363942 RepID=UPI00382103BA